MPFNTFSYFLFLPVVFLVHYFTPDRFRWLVLLVASFCFYAALKAPHLIAVLLFITTITYFTGILIDRQEKQRKKQYLLWGGISANVLTLIILKYLPFITKNLNFLLAQIAPGTTVPFSKTIIAIGVSYFIFQAISYLVDVYLELERSEKNFGYFILYMSFFPKLMQGPIERSALIKQFRRPYVFIYENARSGLIMFAWGMLKKVVVADRLSVYVDNVHGNLHSFTGIHLILAIYFYAIQIYCDFSGYTDMARGSALLFNVKLTNNFNSPYIATSVADFWRRWHISLSSWLQDYIFRPVQMFLRNSGKLGTNISIFITFIICGAWHGSSLNYILWGLLHALYLFFGQYYVIFSKYVDKTFPGTKSYFNKINIIVTFNLIALSWIFFRVERVQDAFYIIFNLHNGLLGQVSTIIRYGINENLRLGSQMGWALLANFVCIIIFIVANKLIKKIDQDEENNCTTLIGRWTIYMFITSVICIFGVFGTDNFIYTNF